MYFHSDLAPYYLLATSIGLLVFFRTVVSAAVFFGLALIAGLFTHHLEPIALAWIAALALSLYLLVLGKAHSTFLRWFLNLAFIGLAAAFFLHKVSGFNNQLIVRSTSISPDSLPYTMYLNFDKPLVGLLILFFAPELLRARSAFWPSYKKILIQSLKFAGGCCLVLMVLALSAGEVRFDPKIPDFTVPWLISNLFFTSVSEEAFFRGYVQGNLQEILKRKKWGFVIALLCSSIIFALVHLAYGWKYSVFAWVAGLFYGAAYLKDGRLETPILVHFLLNTVHFFFFSYPVLGQ